MQNPYISLFTPPLSLPFHQRCAPWRYTCPKNKLVLTSHYHPNITVCTGFVWCIMICIYHSNIIEYFYCLKIPVFYGLLSLSPDSQQSLKLLLCLYSYVFQNVIWVESYILRLTFHLVTHWKRL